MSALLRSLLFSLLMLPVLANPSTYRSESPLPQGWPVIGPYDAVVEKTLPAFRAAGTKGSIQNFTFLRLFRHIKKQNIPMTAPVMMPLKEGGLDEVGMLFLYQNPDVEGAPSDKKISILDIPKQRVLSYSFQGNDGKDKKRKTKELIQEYAKNKNLTLGEFYFLGYNSPSCPAEEKTWEMQAVITSAKKP